MELGDHNARVRDNGPPSRLAFGGADERVGEKPTVGLLTERLSLASFGNGGGQWRS